MSETQGGYQVPEESEQLDQIQAEDSLVDRGVDDVLDEGLTTPENWSAGERDEHENLDQRLAEEEPDVGADDEEREYDDFLDDGEVGGRRSGRLVDPNEGTGSDDESELYGTDVGIDGAAASAEEAAVHVIDDDR
ncbi:DUF5709 domain-containing protein [Microlunatus soli]|uniref:DUF5709 domain-containing protein n=1 Tax=Microlunatus soli TaxID=630515 RepID=A0A1H1YSC1_9ACTN|nr:DUF5709 domain-containing protein [Microlunatus soli]SDT24260.1 hypothetical protein SAMN04489812_4747 [Microlunatus soli]